MRKYLFYGFLLGITWMFVNGSISVPTLISGLSIGIPVMYFFRRFYPGKVNLKKLRKTPLVLLYILSFLKELALSNLEVAYLVIHPSMPINPGIIEYRTELGHPTAVTFLANSITLTPGTLTVDYDQESNKLTIHCLKRQDKKETAESIKKWEKQLKEIFGDKK